jgi:hypothetical protein
MLRNCLVIKKEISILGEDFPPLVFLNYMSWYFLIRGSWYLKNTNLSMSARDTKFGFNYILRRKVWQINCACGHIFCDYIRNVSFNKVCHCLLLLLTNMQSLYINMAFFLVTTLICLFNKKISLSFTSFTNNVNFKNTTFSTKKFFTRLEYSIDM